MWYPLNVFYVLGCLLNSPHHMRILTNANVSSVASYVKITELIFLLAALHGLSVRCGTCVVYWPCSCLWLACWLWNPVAETICLYILVVFGGKLFDWSSFVRYFTQSDFDNEKGYPQANVNNGFCPPPSLKCGWPEACNPQQVQDRHSAPGAGGQRGRVHGCRPQGVHLQRRDGRCPTSLTRAGSSFPAAGNWGLTPTEGSVHTLCL